MSGNSDIIKCVITTKITNVYKLILVSYTQSTLVELLRFQLNQVLKMANITPKFPDRLEAVEDELHHEPQVQENVGSVELEEGASVQGGRETGSSVGEIMNKRKQSTADLLTENQKKIEDLELILVQLQENLNKETQLRLDQEEKLTELQAKVNEETKLRLDQEEQLIHLRTKLNKETQLRLRQEQEVKNIKEELHERTNVRITELENYMKVRVKLEETCAELGRKLKELTAEVQKVAAKQKKPKLTAEEQEKYGKQLHEACGHGGNPDIYKVRTLLSMGVDCNARHDEDNSTPLHRAAIHGCPDICQVLLDAGALVNPHCDRNNTPLHSAARYGQLSVVMLLTEHDADCSLRNDDGQTALDRAVSYNQIQVANYLVDPEFEECTII